MMFTSHLLKVTRNVAFFDVMGSTKFECINVVEAAVFALTGAFWII
jgi:hypothetical protein